MELKSKIKELFSERLRTLIAAVSDTRMIENNQEKMDLVYRLFHSNGVPFEILGGATNRIVGMVDGYAIKISLDSQGYKDNLMEYGLSQETQPYTTKSYETNGYILVQECVRLITIEEWRARKIEILKILDALGREYLLGDVGYFDRNMANWGVRDNGELVILDYAYCHRLTESLFTCPVCGSLLTYDQNFVNIICTDRANCHERYDYNAIKAAQGDQVDWDMIADKKNKSVIVPNGVNSVHVDQESNMLLDSKTFVIKSYRDLALYREATMITIDYTNPEILQKMVNLTTARAIGDTEEVQRLLLEIYGTTNPEENAAEVKCVIDPEFEERMMEDKFAEEQAMRRGYDGDNNTPDESDAASAVDNSVNYLNNLIDSLRGTSNVSVDIDIDQDESDVEYDLPETIGITKFVNNCGMDNPPEPTLDWAQRQPTSDVVITTDDSNETFTDEPVDAIADNAKEGCPDNFNGVLVYMTSGESANSGEEVYCDGGPLSMTMGD